MMDFVCLAMVGILAALGWSVYQVKFHRRFQLHKRLQLILAMILFVAVAAFEIDVRFISGWEERAKDSPFFATWVYPSLYVHLFFSITTPPLWAFVIVQAIRKIPNPPGPSAYSRPHIVWAKLASIDLLLTTITGWIFYYLAFAAK